MPACSNRYHVRSLMSGAETGAKKCHVSYYRTVPRSAHSTCECIILGVNVSDYYLALCALVLHRIVNVRIASASSRTAVLFRYHRMISACQTRKHRSFQPANRDTYNRQRSSLAACWHRIGCLLLCKSSGSHNCYLIIEEKQSLMGAGAAA